MALPVTQAVWGGFPGSGSELLAMLALADHADESGLCWPSIPLIARKIRLSVDQTRRVVHRLIDAGYLQVLSGNNGGGGSRRYLIQLHRLTPCADATPCSDARGGVDAREPLATTQAPPLHSYASRTINEPSVTVKKNSSAHKAAFDPLARLAELGVQQQIANDWLTLRRAKKAPVTNTAIQTVASEATKAGITLDTALSECCARGWQGFKASWLADGQRKGASAGPLTKQHYGQGGYL